MNDEEEVVLDESAFAAAVANIRFMCNEARKRLKMQPVDYGDTYDQFPLTIVK